MVSNDIFVRDDSSDDGPLRRAQVPQWRFVLQTTEHFKWWRFDVDCAAPQAQRMSVVARHPMGQLDVANMRCRRRPRTSLDTALELKPSFTKRFINVNKYNYYIKVMTRPQFSVGGSIIEFIDK